MLRPITPESADRLSALVIAEAGVGKTSLIRTLLGQEWREGGWVQVRPLEEHRRVLVLAAEPGLLAVRDLVQGGWVEGFRIGNFGELFEAYQALQSPEAQARYGWIVLDSLSEISDRCVAEMKAKYPGKDDSFKLWGEYTDLMEAVVKAYRDFAPYHVLFTCLPAIEKDEIGRRFVAPAVAGKKIQGRLTSYFDLVLYLTVVQGEESSYRALFTQPYDRYPAKDRSGRLQLMEPPNLWQITQKILGNPEA